MSVRRRVLGLGLKALNRIAALPGMDQPERRKKLAGFLKNASRVGFKTALAMNRPFVTVDSGVTATIASSISGGIGINKSGPGTLRLTGSNSYLGGTTIKGGVVQVSGDSALGAVPSTSSGARGACLDRLGMKE